jgi:hypothetical protein
MKTAKELNDFTMRMLLALKTAQMDDDRETMRTIIDSLGEAHGIPATYPPQD